MPIRQLVYFSTAADGIGPDDIAEILATSRANNARVGVSGLLLFVNGVFAQVLEGDPASVEAVYARIVADPRHQDPEILSDRTVERRTFDDWSMAYLETTADDLARSAGLDRLLNNPSLLPSLEDHPEAVESGIAQALAAYADQLTRLGEDGPRVG
jgi:hypothetical protein